MAKFFVLALLPVVFFVVGCASSSGPPKKKSLSTQPHNRPASWEGQGGLGAAMGQQLHE